jgi:hypothetical protein
MPNRTLKFLKYKSYHAQFRHFLQRNTVNLPGRGHQALFAHVSGVAAALQEQFFPSAAHTRNGHETKQV